MCNQPLLDRKDMKIEFQYTQETASNQEVLAKLLEVNSFSFVKKFSTLFPYVKYLKNKIPNDSNLIISSIIDYPFGVLPTDVRLDLIKQSVSDGAKSIELTMPSYLINNRQNVKIRKDIEKCYEVCSQEGVGLHYVLEYRQYNYSCLSRLVKFILNFNLNDIYISTGYRIDDIYDHIIAMAMISKENDGVRIIPNCNIYTAEHLEILRSSSFSQFRVNSLPILTLIREKYQI